MSKQYFTDELEPEIDEQYKPINVLWIICLIFGVLSLFVVFNATFLFLPLLAYLFALVAAIYGFTRERVHSGKMLGLVGVFLATLFCSWKVSYETNRRNFVTKMAIENCDEWLGLLKERELNFAHQLTLDYTKRELPKKDLEKHYSKIVVSEQTSDQQRMMAEMGREPYEDKLSFFSAEPLATIIEHAPDADFEYVEIDTYHHPREAKDQIAVRYTMSYTDEGKPEEFDFRVVVERKYYGPKLRAHWNVVTVADMGSKPTQMQMKQRDFKDLPEFLK